VILPLVAALSTAFTLGAMLGFAIITRGQW
jgi:hypothetical protein